MCEHARCWSWLAVAVLAVEMPVVVVASFIIVVGGPPFPNLKILYLEVILDSDNAELYNILDMVCQSAKGLEKFVLYQQDNTGNASDPKLSIQPPPLSTMAEGWATFSPLFT